MEILILILVAFGASWLTFFSGFGLGTLLTPVFILLFKDPVLGIASTAVVHFLNNVFKFILMKRSVNWAIVKPFGLAAIPAAFLGAFLISEIQDVTLLTYELGSTIREVYLLNTVFAVVLMAFALVELIPSWSLAFSKQSLWIGGAISGFFGGLSGHQGALRSAFLLKYQLKKEVFIATGIVVALIVDLVRTPIYFYNVDITQIGGGWTYIAIALGAALLGAISGRFLLKKIKMRFLTVFVSVIMIVFAIALAGGFLNK